MSLKLIQALYLPLLQEFRHRPEMLLDLTVPELVELVHKTVKKIPVMGHDYQRPVIRLECLLEDIL